MPAKGDLKHFELYKDRLLDYAAAHNLKVIMSDSDGDSTFVPATRTIKIDPELEPTEEIASFLHELGHFFDDTLRIDGSPEWEALNNAYRTVYRKNCTDDQLTLIIACELRAWKNGRAIARTLKIRLGKWYDAYKFECLRAYLT